LLEATKNRAGEFSPASPFPGITQMPVRCSRDTFAVLMFSLALTGCSSYVSTNPGEQVDVSGQVTAPSGKSVAGYNLFFHPTGGEAQQVQFPLSATGTFSGKMVAGPYTYYLTPGTGKANEKTLESFPPAYRTGSLDRKIEVKAGVLDLKFE
jgi:hypothetical protein